MKKYHPNMHPDEIKHRYIPTENCPTSISLAHTRYLLEMQRVLSKNKGRHVKLADLESELNKERGVKPSLRIYRD